MKKYISSVNIISLLATIVMLSSIIISSKIKVSEFVNIENYSARDVVEFSADYIYNLNGEKIDVNSSRKLPKGKYYFFVNELMEDDYTPLFIDIISANTKLEASCGSDIFYRSNLDSKLKNLNFHSFNIIEIPKKYNGKDIKIAFDSTNGIRTNTYIPKVYIGSKRALLSYFQIKNYKEILFGIILFFIAYVTLFASLILFNSKANYYQVYYVSIFSLIISILIFINTEFIKLIFPDSTALYYIYYILMSILSLPLLLLFNYQLESIKLDEKYIDIVRHVFRFEVVVLIIELLYMFFKFGKVQNYHYFVVTNIIFSAIVMIFIILKLDYKKHKSKIIMAVITLFVLLIYFENIFIYFQIVNIAEMVKYTSIYALFFLFSFFTLALDEYYTSYKKLEITNFYEKIAFVDSLTGLGTRAALVSEIESIKKEKNKKIIIMFIDVNSLKHINDKMGHDVGDKVLRTLGNMIIELESMYKNICGFRFGGDEFIIIVRKRGENFANELKSFLKNNSEKIRNSDKDIPISLAVAYDEILVDDGTDIEELIKNVDEKMYEDKLKEKNEKYKKE